MITLQQPTKAGASSGLAFILLAFLASCGSEPANGTFSSSRGAVNPQRLVGHWVRPDGGYVLEINRVKSSGKLEARYLNPRPIHVETAELRQDDQGIGVFIELKDRGYPGSYYELEYRESDDILIGNYFQAAQQVFYEVVFMRRQ